jgi:hypothetical protein
VAETDRYKTLSLALIVFGLIFIVGIYPMTRIWPEGWRWVPNQPEYEGMIMGVYATLGIFMLLASRNPAEHRSLILFAAWSSIVHALIMAFQGHLFGDVPALALVGVLLLVLAPKRSPAS